MQIKHELIKKTFQQANLKLSLGAGGWPAWTYRGDFLECDLDRDGMVAYRSVPGQRLDLPVTCTLIAMRDEEPNKMAEGILKQKT